jgi:hypothetical protein
LALFIQSCLVLGWIVAPAADAWAFHQASATQPRPVHLPAAEVPTEHTFNPCAIVIAANLPQAAASNPPVLILHFSLLLDRIGRDLPSPVRSTASLLPLSRAPPAAL